MSNTHLSERLGCKTMLVKISQHSWTCSSSQTINLRLHFHASLPSPTQASTYQPPLPFYYQRDQKRRLKLFFITIPSIQESRQNKVWEPSPTSHHTLSHTNPTFNINHIIQPNWIKPTLSGIVPPTSSFLVKLGSCVIIFCLKEQQKLNNLLMMKHMACLNVQHNLF